MTVPDFRYWDSVEPSTFLEHDWANPSRVWATTEAIKAAKGGSLLEVGPGPGVDYERAFSKAEGIDYAGWEGSGNLCAALRVKYPDAAWVHGQIADLGEESADVVYTRHVLEHQPALEPALSQLLGAARKAVVLTWYRPPGPVAFFEVWEGVHCQTFQREEVMQSVAAAGWKISKRQTFPTQPGGVEGGDEGWVLKPR